MNLSSRDLPSRIKIGNKYVGDGSPTFFIAEIGNNHNGDYYLARRIIEESVKAGADAVKLQKRFVTETFARELLERPQTEHQVFGDTYKEYREHQELNQKEFADLKKFSEDLGVLFFATAHDQKSADFLEGIGIDVYKVASFDITNIPLLEHVARKGKPIFLSSGGHTLEEFDAAVEVILRHHNQLIINHCVSMYPTPDEFLNLASISFLRDRYRPLPIGYSGHEKDILPSIASVMLGAKSIERHITLNKALPGPDHATVSLEPEEFGAMVTGVRRLEKALGVMDKHVVQGELEKVKKHGKSIVSRAAIPAGTVITADMLACKAPGYGLKPNMLPHVIGKTVKRDISEDAVLVGEDILW